MLEPNKYTNVALSVVGISSSIIKQLAKDPNQKYNTLLTRVIGANGEGAKTNFVSALTFLYATDTVRYESKKDIVMLNGYTK
jgi:recombinational DNA repair ATPase RecF